MHSGARLWQGSVRGPRGVAHTRAALDALVCQVVCRAANALDPARATISYEQRHHQQRDSCLADGIAPAADFGLPNAPLDALAAAPRQPARGRCCHESPPLPLPLPKPLLVLLAVWADRRAEAAWAHRGWGRHCHCPAHKPITTMILSNVHSQECECATMSKVGTTL
jgi:hypothetical protein